MYFVRNIKKNEKIYLYFFLFSVVVALFAFGSSPFYPIVDWADPNCFLTVGRAVLDGKVIYRDIYEQKGFYVYFIHAFCALISDSSFIGVFFVEIALLFLVLFFAWKILEVYSVENVLTKLVVVTLFGLSVAFSHAMSTGNSVEEFVSPFFLWVLYLTVKHIKKEDAFSKREYFLIGILAGVVFWSKFTLVAFFIGWFVFFVCINIRRKTEVEIGKCIAFVAVGAVTATLPGVIYFLVNRAVGDWLRVYLYDNLFVYSGNRGVLQTILYPIINIFLTLLQNVFYGIFVVFGVVWFLLKKRGEERLLLTFVPIVTALGLFAGGRGYRYYGLPLYIFAIFGYISLLEIDVEKFVRARLWTKIVIPVLAIVFCFSFFITNGSAHYIFREKEDTVQYTFAEYIKKEGGENATLLNYGFLDRGFYLALDQIPEFKYFCTLNIPLEDMQRETERYIREGIPDFVVALISGKDSDMYFESENYSEVLREECWYRAKRVTYILYQKNEMPSTLPLFDVL